MKCFGIGEKRKNYHIKIVLLDDTELIQEIEVSLELLTLTILKCLMSLSLTLSENYEHFIKVEQSYDLQINICDTDLQDISRGQHVLDVVFKHLNLLETAYFGLRFIDAKGQPVSDVTILAIINKQ